LFTSSIQCLIYDIFNYFSVEDPSESFQRVRDFVDARNCQKLASFQPSELHKGFTEEMEHDARYKLKLNRVSCVMNGIKEVSKLYCKLSSAHVLESRQTASCGYAENLKCQCETVK
jgi:hypothetical protein